MFAYTYRAYWREQGATDWNEIQSSSPITWGTEITPPSDASGYEGGQCTGVNYQVYFGATGRSTNCSGVTVSPRTRAYGPVSTPRAGPIGQIVAIGVNPTNCGFGNWAIRVFRPNGQLYFGGTGFFSPGVSGNARIELDTFNVGVVRIDGQPDNCGNNEFYNPGSGGECITTFSTGLVVTRPQCIEVTTAPPECPCCGDLLPKANSILARLG